MQQLATLSLIVDLQLQVLKSFPGYLKVGWAAKFYFTLADDGMFEPTKDCLTWEHYEMEDQIRGELVPFSLGRLPDWMLVIQGFLAHLLGFGAWM